MADSYLPIGEYAFLSDCHSTALVSRSGSIDWACFRRFDSPTAFARLLDARRGGHFSITPSGGGTSCAREYIADTLVLRTTFSTSSGVATLTDAMVMSRGGADHPRHEMIRLVEGVDGAVAIAVDVVPRFDYGLTVPLVRGDAVQGRYTVVGGAEGLVVQTAAPLKIDRPHGSLHGHFTVGAGESCGFLLTSRSAHRVDELDSSVGDIDDRLRETIEWWQRWTQSLTTRGRHGDVMRRSAIVLKGLTCAPTGAVIAAATTSLPEEIGGTRNWDYRYSWVRDSSLVVEALAGLGHAEVARGFRDFLVRSAAGNAADLQIMYGAYGERRLTELEIDLDGYRGSRPVRIGNGAASQTQLDVYGHLLDAVDTWHDGVTEFESSEREFLCDAVDLAAQRWIEPDQGIWEMRGAPRHFVHSKVMCWVALDRGIRLGKLLAVDDAQLDRWKAMAERIRAEVMHRGIDPARGNFRQHYETVDVDASLLKLPLVGFIDANHPAMLATVEAIQEDLSVGESGFVRRYAPMVDDGVAPGRNDEGVFLLATCWLIENLALQGRHDEGHTLFDGVLATANDIGLLAEQYDVAGGEMLGNFPQAFTHLGLLVAAQRLEATAPT